MIEPKKDSFIYKIIGWAVALALLVLPVVGFFQNFSALFPVLLTIGVLFLTGMIVAKFAPESMLAKIILVLMFLVAVVFNFATYHPY